VAANPADGGVKQHSQRSLDDLPAEELVRWAWRRYERDLVLASSFQDCVLIDIACRAAPEIDVLFIDTGYHFPETLDFVSELTDRYGFNLVIVEDGRVPDNLWQRDVDACCYQRKVAPFRRALRGKKAWMSGLRRVESPARSDAQVVSFSREDGLVKINPLAAWSDADVERYAEERSLPRHPLWEKGYLSVGCRPCTDPVTDKQAPRTGRWSGTGKTECGLHLEEVSGRGFDSEGPFVTPVSVSGVVGHCSGNNGSSILSVGGFTPGRSPSNRSL
jgi:phosphoadenosine phosphosulfate reductase